MRTEPCSGSIGKCISRMTRCFMRNSILLLVISDSVAGKPNTPASVCWSVGINGTRRQRGAEVIFYPTAIGWHPSEKAEFGERQHSSWETVQRGHAIANGCYVAVPNRVGHEDPAGGDGLDFWGRSFIAGAAGQILAKAGEEKPEVVIASIDPKALDLQRTHWPFLRDRRIERYAEDKQKHIDII